MPIDPEETFYRQARAEEEWYWDAREQQAAEEELRADRREDYEIEEAAMPIDPKKIFYRQARVEMVKTFLVDMYVTPAMFGVPAMAQSEVIAEAEDRWLEAYDAIQDLLKEKFPDVVLEGFFTDDVQVYEEA